MDWIGPAQPHRRLAETDGNDVRETGSHGRDALKSIAGKRFTDMNRIRCAL